jgi:hypothetical protein
MAVGQWTFYNMFREYMADGTLDLDTTGWRIALFTSASNANTATLSIYNQINNEVASVTGYSTSGKTLSGVTWITGASAGVRRWDATATVWTATASPIANVRHAVIYKSAGTSAGRKLVCYSTLSTAQFTISTGNTLTITPSATGIFELT